jgi:hypothetical protein
MKVQRPLIGSIPCRTPDCGNEIQFFNLKAYLRAVQRPNRPFCRKCAGGIRYEEDKSDEPENPPLANFWGLIAQQLSGSQVR